MRTIRIEGPGDIRVATGEMPRRKKGEALLKLLCGGICGSDLGSYRGSMAYVKYPRIPGHEFSARIVEIDPNPDGLAPGALVTGNPYFNCAHCYSCERGMVNCCMDNQTMGVQRDGAFSEYFTMPVERLYDGSGIPPRELALIEPFCIGHHAVRQAQVERGDKVLVIGAGTIGISCALSAKLRGAEVHLCDVAEGKLDHARRFGMDGYVLNSSPEEFARQVESATGRRGFDVTIEAVGLPSTFQDCVDAAAYGGRMVLVGVGKKNLDFNFTVIQKKELRISGSRNALKADFVEAIALARDGGLPLAGMITDVYPFESAARAFADFDRDSGRMLKVLLEF